MAPRRRSKIGPAESGFALDEYVLYNLVRTAATYSDEMAKALKRRKLELIAWRVLMLLRDKSPSSVGELARRSVTKMPTLTRALTRMEEDGLIVRKTPEGDRRIVQITMTPKAATALLAVQSIGQKVFERALDGIGPHETAALTGLLRRIRANLDRSCEKAEIGVKRRAS